VDGSLYKADSIIILMTWKWPDLHQELLRDGPQKLNEKTNEQSNKIKNLVPVTIKFNQANSLALRSLSCCTQRLQFNHL